MTKVHTGSNVCCLLLMLVREPGGTRHGTDSEAENIPKVTPEYCLSNLSVTQPTWEEDVLDLVLRYI